MLFVAMRGLKLFTTLHCKNYFNVIIAAKTKDVANEWFHQEQAKCECLFSRSSPVIPTSRKIFSRMYQWLIFLDTVYFVHCDASLPLAFQTRSFQAFFSLSITIVFVLGRDVNQDFSCLQNWVTSFQTTKPYRSVCIRFIWLYYN